MKSHTCFFVVVAVALCGVLTVPGVLADSSAPVPDFSATDKAVLDLGPVGSLEELVSALEMVSRSDIEKARAIYRWMSANIAYDTEAFFGDSQTAAFEPEEVFRAGKSVCSGYSALFHFLAKSLGLRVITIGGRAKGYGYTTGDPEIDINHDWNAVLVDRTWRLVDVTWGAGYINDDRAFQREFSTFWFDCPPELFVLWHLPEREAWQLLDTPVSLATYLAKPYFSHQQFEALADMGVPSANLISWHRSGTFPDDMSMKTLMDYGFSLQAVLDALAQGELPNCHDFPDLGLRILRAPLGRKLPGGRRFSVSIEAKDLEEAAIINNGEWTYLKRQGSQLAADLVPTAGPLYLNIHTSFEGEKAWWRLLEYEVASD